MVRKQNTIGTPWPTFVYPQPTACMIRDGQKSPLIFCLAVRCSLFSAAEHVLLLIMYEIVICHELLAKMSS